MTRRLDDEEIDRQLLELPGWVRDEAALRREIEAPDFRAAVRVVDEVADEAEQMDHHPDIDIRWRTVRFVCSTHSEGGITQLDVELAHRIEAAARRHGAT